MFQVTIELYLDTGWQSPEALVAISRLNLVDRFYYERTERAGILRVIDVSPVERRSRTEQEEQKLGRESLHGCV